MDRLWRAFLDYLNSPQGDDDEALDELTERLRDVKRRLADRAFLEGDTPTANDLALAPRLHHIFAALPQLKARRSLAALPANLHLCAWIGLLHRFSLALP